MGLFYTYSEIDGNFSGKSQNFPTTGVLCAPAEGGYPYNWVPALGPKKTRMMGYTGPTPSGITQLNQFQGESLKGLNTPG